MINESKSIRPGGKLFRELAIDSKYSTFVDAWQKLLKDQRGLFPALTDPLFVKAFCETFPDLESQLNYVENTSNFLTKKSDYDPCFVLLFRRTLPSNEPKPEEHWTSDYFTARRGLRNEIPGNQRKKTIILCASLGKLLETLGHSDQANNSQSDGEIKFHNKSFDQLDFLFSFKPPMDSK